MTGRGDTSRDGPSASAATAELDAQAREAITRLADSADPAAFQALLGLSQLVGEALGRSARSLAASSSWRHVADYSGTTKQAAWSRWRE
jgi:hypothetical protein